MNCSGKEVVESFSCVFWLLAVTRFGVFAEINILWISGSERSGAGFGFDVIRLWSHGVAAESGD